MLTVKACPLLNNYVPSVSQESVLHAQHQRHPLVHLLTPPQKKKPAHFLRLALKPMKTHNPNPIKNIF